MNGVIKHESVATLLNTFKARVYKAFPGFIEQIVLFGSEARGEAGAFSDIDVLVVTAYDDWEKGDEIRSIGYELDMLTDSRLSIQVLSRAHMDTLRKNRYHFAGNIEREGIAV